MVAQLDAVGMNGFTYPESPAGTRTDLRLFVRGPETMLKHLEDDPNDHMTIRRLFPRTKNAIIVVAVHFQSKATFPEADQAQLATRLRPKIEEIEKRYGVRRTIVVGDLNMNPFELGVISSEGLHAMMTKQIARAGSRKVAGEERPFFYNPMWRFFGERGDGPPGTHYYPAGGKIIAFHWNIFDQVLVRPDLMDRLQEVRILDRIDAMPLLNDNGLPANGIGSDHLPLYFALDL